MTVGKSWISSVFPGMDSHGSQASMAVRASVFSLSKTATSSHCKMCVECGGQKNYQNVFIFKKIQDMFVFVASVPIEKQHNPLVFGEALCAKLRDENILQVVQHDGGVAMH